MTDKKGEAELYALFDQNGIAYTHNTHPPLHTVEESKELRGDLPAGSTHDFSQRNFPRPA